MHVVSLVILLGTTQPQCDPHMRATLIQPAQRLAPAAASRYPSGIEANVTLRVNASGRVLSASTDAPGVARDGIIRWAKSLTFKPLDPACGSDVQDVDLANLDFFPPASGVVGQPHIVGGVDFDNFTYTDGPGNCKIAHMKDAYAGYSPEIWEATVENVFAGSIAGRPTAIAVLRCEYNGHGFDQNAQLFTIHGGKAKRIAILGEGSMAGPDSPFPPWPGGWLHVSYAGGKLYADVWDYAHQCNPRTDWIVTTYTIRNGRLAALNTMHHHRAGGNGPACSP